MIPRHVWSGSLGVLYCAALFACDHATPTIRQRALEPDLTSSAGVLTQHNNAARTGAKLDETALKPSNVSFGSFGLLSRVAIPANEGNIFAQPLYVPGVDIGGTKRDALFVLTDQGHLFAIDTALALTNPSQSYVDVVIDPTTDAYFSGPKSKVIELFSAPVIDPASRNLFVVYKRLRPQCTSDQGQPANTHQCQNPTATDKTCTTTRVCTLAKSQNNNQVAWGHFCDDCYEFVLARIPIDNPSWNANAIVTFGSPSSNAVIRCDRGCAPGDTTCAPRVFDAVSHRSRPGLLLSNGLVYAGFGAVPDWEGQGDVYEYHGWIVAFDPQTFAPAATFCVTPHPADYPGLTRDGTRKSGGGIWQSGNGLVADAMGNVYFDTSNGMYENVGTKGNLNPLPTRPGDSFENSLVKLPAPTRTAGTYEWSTATSLRTPCNYQLLEANDLDFGSGGPILLPDGTLVGGGKFGTLHHVSSNIPAGAQDGQISEFQAFTNQWDPAWANDTINITGNLGLQDTYAPNIHGGLVYWRGPAGGHIYGWSEKDFLRAFKYDETAHDFVYPGPPSANVCSFDPQAELPVQLTNAFPAPAKSMPGGFLSLSANGSLDGIVWATIAEPFGPCQSPGDYYAGGTSAAPCDDRAFQAVPGRLYAFDASTLELLYEVPLDARHARTVPPTIAAGKVYVAEHSGTVNGKGKGSEIEIFGIKPSITPAGTPQPRYRPFDIDGDKKVDLLVRGHEGYFSVYRSDGANFNYASGFVGMTPVCPNPIPNIKQDFYCPPGIQTAPDGTSMVQPLHYDDDGGFNQNGRFIPLQLDGQYGTDLIARRPSGELDIWLSDGKTLKFTTSQVQRSSADGSVGLYSDKAGYGLDNQFFAADLNGDGKEELIVRNADGSFDLWGWSNSAASLHFVRRTAVTGFTDASNWGNGNRFFFLDIDGDKRDEMLVRAPNGDIWVWRSPPGQQMDLQFWYWFATPYADGWCNGASNPPCTPRVSSSRPDVPTDWFSGPRFYAVRMNGHGALLARWPDGLFDVNIPRLDATDQLWKFPTQNVPTFATHFNDFWMSGQTAVPNCVGNGPSHEAIYFGDLDGTDDGNDDSDLIVRNPDGVIEFWQRVGDVFQFRQGTVATRFNDCAGWSVGARFL